MDWRWILYEAFLNREKYLYGKLLRLETIRLGSRSVRDRCHHGADREREARDQSSPASIGVTQIAGRSVGEAPRSPLALWAVRAHSVEVCEIRP